MTRDDDKTGTDADSGEADAKKAAIAHALAVARSLGVDVTAADGELAVGGANKESRVAAVMEAYLMALGEACVIRFLCETTDGERRRLGAIPEAPPQRVFRSRLVAL